MGAGLGHCDGCSHLTPPFSMLGWFIAGSFKIAILLPVISEPLIYVWQELLNHNKGAWQSALNPFSIPTNNRSPRFARDDRSRADCFASLAKTS